MEKYSWLFRPSQTTMTHVTVFYALVIGRFAVEWAACICMVVSG